MSQIDTFSHILTSLHQAMLDDTHWPTASALIDDACGMTGNELVVAEGLGDNVEIRFARFYQRGERRPTWSAPTSTTTTRGTNACRACASCRTAAWRTSPSCTPNGS